MFSKINQNSQKNTCAGVSFNKVAGWSATTLTKKTSSLVFPCKLYKIFKNTYFVEHLRTAASVSHLATSDYVKHSKFRIWFSERLFICILASTSVWNVSLKIISQPFISYLYLSVFFNLLVSLLYHFFITIFSLKLFLKNMIKTHCELSWRVYKIQSMIMSTLCFIFQNRSLYKI